MGKVFMFDAVHLEHFVECLRGHKEQQEVGMAPLKWLDNTLKGIDERLRGEFPREDFLSSLERFGGGARMLTRKEVAEVCRADVDPIVGYVCAMAWGGQFGKNTARALGVCLSRREEFSGCCLACRRGHLLGKRGDAYELFRALAISGLGPSFFTKVLYFFSPAEAHTHIMDQWTAKSMILLTQDRKLVLMSKDGIRGSSPTSRNTPGNYETFCSAVDALSSAREVVEAKVTRESIEERLFSVGANGQPRGPWRKYVMDEWAKLG